MRVFTITYLSFYDATCPYHYYRIIIQLLISGYGRTEVVVVHLDSPGQTLYRAIQEKRGILVALVYGVNIIRHGVSLREQGLHHLSTVFVLPVMGEGGGRTRLGKRLSVGKQKREGGKHRRGDRGKGGASGWCHNFKGAYYNYYIMQHQLKSKGKGMGKEWERRGSKGRLWEIGSRLT